MTKDIKKFEIIGNYRKKKNIYNIRQVIEAESKNYAIEKLYSLIGSRHRVKRNNIEILEVKENE
ncbi:MAG: 50S ribosomal protein L18a [Candidatus Lokiarchaeota archaeon]|nr:50S ribosomal protein L18a [Candidatus Lokiarchaeota archaeon]